MRKLLQFIPKFLAIVLATYFSSACIPTPSTPSIFSPPPGEYPTAITVTLDIPNADQIFVTTDGEIPTTDCNPYDGSPISVENSLIINVLYVVDGVEHTAAGAYVIADAISSSGPFTNQDMIIAAQSYIAGLWTLFKNTNNGGNEPGLGNLGDLWTIDDGVGGSATAVTVAEGFGGKLTITYKGYSYNGLRITGKTVGHFNSSGSGITTTISEGQTLVVSGTYNGTLAEDYILTGGNLTGGVVETTCSDSGCASGAVKYAAPSWTLLSAGENVLSCDQPYLHIRNTARGQCMVWIDTGSLLWNSGSQLQLEVAPCNAETANQQWELVPTGNSYSIRSLDPAIPFSNGGCITDYNDPGVHEDEFIVNECSGATTQQMIFEGSGNNIRFRPASRNAYLMADTDFVQIFTGSDNVWGFDLNALTEWTGLFGMRWGFYLEGDFSTPVVPTILLQP